MRTTRKTLSTRDKINALCAVLEEHQATDEPILTDEEWSNRYVLKTHSITASADVVRYGKKAAKKFRRNGGAEIVPVTANVYRVSDTTTADDLRFVVSGRTFGLGGKRIGVYFPKSADDPILLTHAARRMDDTVKALYQMGDYAARLSGRKLISGRALNRLTGEAHRSAPMARLPEQKVIRQRLLEAGDQA